MKNPAQISKEVRSSAVDVGETVRAISVRTRDDYAPVLGLYLEALDNEADEPATVLILGRYRRNEDDVRSVLRAPYANLTVTYNTMHASKGKEADYVVVLRLEHGGFPNTREDDRVVQLAMSAPDPYPNSEERRLFYVALTRARRHVLLLTQTGNESPFLKELVNDGLVTIRRVTSPPRRGRPRAAAQKSPQHLESARKPQTNDATLMACPKCGSRPMVRKTGPFGPFLGCPRYPDCKGTRKLDGTPGRQ